MKIDARHDPFDAARARGHATAIKHFKAAVELQRDGTDAHNGPGSDFLSRSSST